MRSSDLFVVKVLRLACTAPDGSTAIERAGKLCDIKAMIFRFRKGNVTGNQVAQPGIMPGITGEHNSSKEQISTLSRCPEYLGPGNLNSNNT